MKTIEYNCPKCNENFIITNYTPVETKSSIPSPDRSIFMRKFQDHGDHTIFLHFDEDKLKNYQVIPQLRSVFDTLLFDNIQVANIVNTMLRINSYDERSLLLYVTDNKSYLKFFKEISKKYLSLHEEATIIQGDGYMVISVANFDFILANFEVSKNILKKGYKSISYLDSLDHTKLRSLVIDTSLEDESELLKKIKKSKFKLDSGVKIILAFDSRRTKTPPLDLREYFLDKYTSNSIEILNYQDTNGLKSIFLQSYYNILDDNQSIDARETFEIMQRPY